MSEHMQHVFRTLTYLLHHDETSLRSAPCGQHHVHTAFPFWVGLHQDPACRYSWPMSTKFACLPRLRPGANDSCTWFCRWGLLILLLAVVLHGVFHNDALWARGQVVTEILS
jgi:hypothetical protein